MAHNATANPDDGYLHQGTVDAIINLATATARDSVSIAQLTATIERLMNEVTMVD